MENLSNQTNAYTNTVNQPQNQAYPPPLPPEVAEEKRFKRWLYKVFGGNLLYNGVMNICTMAVVAVYMIIIIASNTINGSEIVPTDIMLTILQKTDAGMIISVVAATVVLVLFMRKILKFKDIFVKRKTMTPKSFFSILAVFLGGQFLFTMFAAGAEKLLNLIGFTTQKAVELATGVNESFPMLIYVGFVAPVFEEIVLRGYLMQPLEKTGLGKGYAILVSSVFFGIMHGNIVQSPFAVLVGFALAYAAIEYGVIWAILIHFINNFVISKGLSYLVGILPESAEEYIEIGFLLICFTACVFVLISKRRDVKAYIKENYKTSKKYYKWTFTNPFFWILVVLYTLLSLTTIAKL